MFSNSTVLRLTFFTCLTALLTTLSSAQNAGENQTPIDPEIAQFFERFQASTHEETADSTVSMLDVDAICNGAFEKSGVEIPAFIKAQYPTLVRQKFKEWYELADDQWMRHQVVYTKISEDGLHADAFVRFWDQDYTTSRAHYELVKTDQWRIADSLDISIGISTQWIMGTMLRDGFGEDASSDFEQSAMILVEAIRTATESEDFESAAYTLRRLDGRNVPPGMRQLRWCFAAATELHVDPVYALECADKLEAYEPDAFILELIRCNAYQMLGQYEQTIVEGERLLQRFGPDPDSYLNLGFAAKELGRLDESLEYYTTGLKDTPESYDLVEAFAVALPDDRKSEFLPYFTKLPSATEYLETLADAFEAYEDYAALETLIQYDDRTSQSLPNRAYYDGLILTHQEKYDAAIERLLQGRGILDEEDYYREYYNALITTALIRKQTPIQLYELLETPSEAFTLLINQLDVEAQLAIDNEKDPASTNALIDQLIDFHTTEYPDDPAAYAFVGRRHYHEEAYAEALPELNRALELEKQIIEKSPDDEVLAESSRYLIDELLETIVDCHIELKTLDEFYDSYPDKPQLFDVITYSGYIEDELLETIEKKHRQLFPDASDQIKQYFATEQYDKALQFAQQQIDESVDEPSLQWQYFEICSLAYLKRFDDAILKARELEDGSRDFARAMVYVIKGDRERFKAAFRYAAQHYFEIAHLKYYIELPEDWDFVDSLEFDAVRPFDRYGELRRVVLLLKQPYEINSFSVHRAASEIGLNPSVVQKDALANQTNDQTVICDFGNGKAVLAHNGSEYFLTSGSGPYRGDPRCITYDEFSDEQADLLSKSGGWVAIDIYQWPLSDEIEEISQIPVESASVLAKLAKQFANQNVIGAIHEDSATITAPLPENFFAKLIDQPNAETFDPIAETTELDENSNTPDSEDPATDSP
ncbi:hypothetical protein LOC67_01000 [Stieleria sp. JC731]|uniref:hypothetical protein n=1 Tax=Pirellulaceae TaxID=2691357 RepID=UPI001E2C41BF|nr:hypothetical protein [Stieleria sp. JC731]MCC9599118.1 hypothetical protein [Stieleria sp. JC731]